MSTSIDQAFIKQFEREVHEAYQRGYRCSASTSINAVQQKNRRPLILSTGTNRVPKSSGAAAPYHPASVFQVAQGAQPPPALAAGAAL